MYDKPGMQLLVQHLDQARIISMPYGDNEGDPLNHPAVYPELSLASQRTVDAIETLAPQVLLHPDGTVNRHAIRVLGRHGYPACFATNQYDPMLVDAKVEADENWIELSDQAFQSQDSD
jgi:hypothetical protein